MQNSIHYFNYESDLSGSRTKNRFRYELLWGLDKFFEYYEKNIDFHIVFDLVCDIEIHFSNNYEFYQLKTTKSPAYTVATICSHKNREDGKVDNSILGKLYKLRLTDNANSFTKSKLAIVTNVPLNKESATATKDCEVDFTSFSDTNKKTILDKLASEFPKENTFELSNIVYINSVIPLKSMKELMIGKTITFFESVMGEELIRPTILYGALYEEISNKACYEDNLSTYEEILEKKGISRNRFDVIVNAHKVKSHDIIEKCTKEIDTSVSEFRKKIKLKTSLSALSTGLRINSYLQNLEISIKNDIYSRFNQLGDGNIFQTIDCYLEITDINFPIEFSQTDKQIFVLIILKKIEENIYE